MFKKWFNRYRPLEQQTIAEAIDGQRFQLVGEALRQAITTMLQCAFEAGYRRGLKARVRK